MLPREGIKRSIPEQTALQSSLEGPIVSRNEVSGYEKGSEGHPSREPESVRKQGHSQWQGM